MTWFIWILASFCLETVLGRCKIGAWFALDMQQVQKSFWTHSMVPLGDEAQVEARFGPFEYSANVVAR